MLLIHGLVSDAPVLTVKAWHSTMMATLRIKIDSFGLAAHINKYDSVFLVCFIVFGSNLQTMRLRLADHTNNASPPLCHAEIQLNNCPGLLK